VKQGCENSAEIYINQLKMVLDFLNQYCFLLMNQI